MKQTQIQANFQAIMDEKGLNMRSWALKAGLPETRVKAVMYGRSKNPRSDTLIAMAKAADVHISRLIAGTSPGVDAEILADFSHEIEDQEFFVLWGDLDPDIKIAFLSLLKAITKAVPAKAS